MTFPRHLVRIHSTLQQRQHEVGAVISQMYGHASVCQFFLCHFQHSWPIIWVKVLHLGFTPC